MNTLFQKVCNLPRIYYRTQSTRPHPLNKHDIPRSIETWSRVHKAFQNQDHKHVFQPRLLRGKKEIHFTV